MTIYSTILIIFWIIFLSYWGISALSAKRNKSSPLRSIAFRLLMAVAFIIIFSLQSYNGTNFKVTRVVNPVLGVLGVVLCGLGVGFAIWARHNLGKNWGMPMSVKEKPELVTSGPYQYVRHPIYTGVLLAVLGAILVVGAAWLPMFIIMAAYFIYSAKKEEQIMQNAFPDVYPAYKKRTKMLIPFVF